MICGCMIPMQIIGSLSMATRQRTSMMFTHLQMFYPGAREELTISLLSNNSMILFGGQDNIGPKNDLWILDLCSCPNGDCGPNGLCVTCNPNYFGINCDACTCVNGICDDGISGTGTCTSCNATYYGPNCISSCNCTTGCSDGINGNGCSVPSSSASGSSSDSSSGNSSGGSSSSQSNNSNPTKSSSSSSIVSIITRGTPSTQVKTETSHISKLVVTTLSLLLLLIIHP